MQRIICVCASGRERKRTQIIFEMRKDGQVGNAKASICVCVYV